MANNASLVYTVPQGGASPSRLAEAVEAVAPPSEVIQALGLRITSDITVAGPPVVRTVDVAFGPSAAATATAQTLASQRTGSPVTTVTVTSPGNDYVASPGVQITDVEGTGSGAAGRSFLKLFGVSIEEAGSGYSDSVVVFFYGGLPPGNGSAGQTSFTFQEVLSANVTAGGTGYSSKTVVLFDGGLSPLGKAAQGSVQIRAGVVVGISVTYEGDEYFVAPQISIIDPTGSGSGAAATPKMNPGKTVFYQGEPAAIELSLSVGGHISGYDILSFGSGYTSLPQVVVIDPEFHGSGGVLIPRLQLEKIVVTNGGEGYQSPVVTLTPYFKTSFPDSSDQRAPLFNLMTTALSQAVSTPVEASSPVLS